MTLQWLLKGRLAIALPEVKGVDAFSQSSAVDLLSPFNIIRKPWTLDANVFEDAAVASDPLFDVPVAFPVDVSSEVALIQDTLDDWEWVVVIGSTAS